MPLSGSTRRFTIRRVVDLPHPLGPMRAVTTPSGHLERHVVDGASHPFPDIACRHSPAGSSACHLTCGRTPGAHEAALHHAQSAVGDERHRHDRERREHDQIASPAARARRRRRARACRRPRKRQASRCRRSERSTSVAPPRSAGIASGTARVRITCHSVMPMPNAASTTSAGTPSRPAYVFRTTASNA